MKRGDIYIVTLNPVVGSEQSKTRPCVIVSTDIINDYAQTVTVAPLSSKKRAKPFPFHIHFENGIIKIEHLRTVDKSRLIKRVGRVQYNTSEQIKEAIALYFDIRL